VTVAQIIVLPTSDAYRMWHVNSCGLEIPTTITHLAAGYPSGEIINS
jgi:hypothetical protein